jgi:hypothetical protein
VRETTVTANALAYGGREADFSTAPLTKCVSGFGRNDNFPVRENVRIKKQKQIPSLRCGMTNK